MDWIKRFILYYDKRPPRDLGLSPLLGVAIRYLEQGHARGKVVISVD